MKEIKVMIIKAGSDLPPIVTTIKDDLDEFYKIIECSTIDIVRRKIGGNYYDIICDDEALFVENPIVSVVQADGYPMICGTIIICNNEDSELSSLNDNDIKNIRKHMCIAKIKNLCKCYVLQADI